MKSIIKISTAFALLAAVHAQSDPSVAGLDIVPRNYPAGAGSKSGQDGQQPCPSAVADGSKNEKSDGKKSASKADRTDGSKQEEKSDGKKSTSKADRTDGSKQEEKSNESKTVQSDQISADGSKQEEKSDGKKSTSKADRTDGSKHEQKSDGKKSTSKADHQVSADGSKQEVKSDGSKPEKSDGKKSASKTGQADKQPCPSAGSENSNSETDVKLNLNEHQTPDMEGNSSINSETEVKPNVDMTSLPAGTPGPADTSSDGNNQDYSNVYSGSDVKLDQGSSNEMSGSENGGIAMDSAESPTVTDSMPELAESATAEPSAYPADETSDSDFLDSSASTASFVGFAGLLSLLFI